MPGSEHAQLDGSLDLAVRPHYASVTGQLRSPSLYSPSGLACSDRPRSLKCKNHKIPPARKCEQKKGLKLPQRRACRSHEILPQMDSPHPSPHPGGLRERIRIPLRPWRKNRRHMKRSPKPWSQAVKLMPKLFFTFSNLSRRLFRRPPGRKAGMSPAF